MSHQTTSSERPTNPPALLALLIGAFGGLYTGSLPILEAFAFIALLMAGAGIYQLPAILAFERNIPFKWVLWGLNLAFGFTLMGWFVCLMCALLMQPKPAGEVK